jgi:small-conductance mechanosensitive channel
VEKLLPLAIFGGALAVFLVIRAVLLRLLHRKKLTSTSMAILLDAIEMPSIFWCLAAATDFAIDYSALPPKVLYWASRGVGGFLIISVSLVLSTIAVRIMSNYGERHEMLFATAGLPRTLTRGFVLGIGALMLLKHFNVSITPLLTALGVGGLAVALALQDTLANFFAGVHILVETPIRLGDFVKLSTGEEGVVTDIGWRTTRVRTGSNNTIVIPNTKITSGILTNFGMPDGRVVTEVTIIASLDADPEKIAPLLMEAASSAPGALSDPSPVLLFDPGVTLTHMQFKLLVHVPNQALRGSVQSAIRVHALELFRKHKVPLPGGPTTVVLKQ